MTKFIQKHIPSSLIVDNEIDITLSIHHNNILDPMTYYKYGYIKLNFCIFFGVYITRNCINKIGLLNEHHCEHYYSDNFYCEKINTFGGLEIIYTPKSKIYHFHNKATEEMKKNDLGRWKNYTILK